MHTIVITNQKGGVGKTTTAHAMGTGYGHLKRRVLFIDLDPQGNLTNTLRIVNPKYTALHVLTNEVPIAEALIKTEHGSVLASTRLLSSADLQITQIGKEFRLKEALAEITDMFDCVIVDTPPSLGILTVNAFTAGDEVIIPAQADSYSMQGISQVYDTLCRVREYCNPDIQIAGILLTRFNAHTVLSREIANQLEKSALQFGTKVFNTRIRECITIKEAQARKVDIYSYGESCNACMDYFNFMKEYAGKANG